jgi:hypothetical protein
MFQCLSKSQFILSYIEDGMQLIYLARLLRFKALN